MVLLQESFKNNFLRLHLCLRVKVVFEANKETLPSRFVPHSELLRNAEDLADYEYGTLSEAGALRHLAPGSRKSMDSLRCGRGLRGP